MRGGARNSKPAALRELHGSRNRPRHRQAVHVEPVKALEAPPGLSPKEQEFWRHYEPLLTANRILTAADRESLAMYGLAQAQIVDIRQQQQDPAYRRLVLSITVDGNGIERV